MARQVCAKYAVDDRASVEQVEQVAGFLLRGLVVYLGADKAKGLAAECAKRARAEGP